MAALAFTAYGVHWWAIGMARAFGSDPRPNGFMAIAFTIISVLGIVVFFKALMYLMWAAALNTVNGFHLPL